jgi:hypothetical protein
MYKRINNKLYKIGQINIYNSGDCYYYKNKYYRKDKLIFDWGKREYVYKTNKLKYIVLVKHNDNLIIGYSSKNNYKYFYQGLYIEDKRILEEIGVYYNDKSKLYTPIDTPYARDYFCNLNTKESCEKLFNIKDNYNANSSYLFLEFNEKIKKEVSNSNYNKYLSKYTYGLEYETSAGVPYLDDIVDNYLLPVKDGSIQGLEYCSPIIPGDCVLNVVPKQCDLLLNYCLTNYQCSLHLHIGNIELNPLNLASLYSLCYRLQTEITELFPYYKKDAFLIRAQQPKDYCKYIHNLGVNVTKNPEEIADNIVSWITDGVITSYDAYKSNKLDYIKANSKRKWNIGSRYYIFNFYNLLFGETLEFRIHPGTLNKDRVIAWIMVCTAIVEYALNNQDKIISKDPKINLEDVISEVYKEAILLKNSILEYLDKSKRTIINSHINKDAYTLEYESPKEHAVHIPHFVDFIENYNNNIYYYERKRWERSYESENWKKFSKKRSEFREANS